MRENNSAVSDPERTNQNRRLWALVSVIVLVVLGIAAYANSFNNKALFHHVPNVFTTPILHNSMLRCPKLFPKIFTGELLLTTYGEYRPVGYALFALINRVVPEGVYWPWHVVLLAIHVLTAVLVFFMLRMLVRDMMAAALAAAYVVHPILSPLLNDVNVIYFAWGLLFSVITMWLYLVYLRKDSAFCLLLSILSFVAAVFTFEHAAVVPAFLLALCLFHEDHPRWTAGVLVYLALGALVAAILRVPVWMRLGGLGALVVIASGGIGLARKKYMSLAKTLPPYLVIAGIFLLAVAPGVKPTPLQSIVLDGLDGAYLADASQLWFVGRQMLVGSVLVAISLAVAAAIPFALLLKHTARYAAVAAGLLLLLGTTFNANRQYRDDVTYWEHQNAVRSYYWDVELNLATAYVDEGVRRQDEDKLHKARDLLLWLKYEKGATGLREDVIDPLLGRVYAALGKPKVAGYFFFRYRQWGWNLKIMNNRLKAIADYCLPAGYLSIAEHNWACADVLDKYDLELHNNMGKVLLYKNFYRAAAKYFRYVLDLDPDNATALQHLAFATKAVGDEKEYQYCQKRLQAVTGSGPAADYRASFETFTRRKRQMIEWFTEEPMCFFQHLLTDAFENPSKNPYRVEYKGKQYDFAEVPLEIGKHFATRNKYRRALAYLRQSHEANPKLTETIEKLVEVHRKLNQPEKAEGFEKLLERAR